MAVIMAFTLGTALGTGWALPVTLHWRGEGGKGRGKGGKGEGEKGEKREEKEEKGCLYPQKIFRGLRPRTPPYAGGLRPPRPPIRIHD